MPEQRDLPPASTATPGNTPTPDPWARAVEQLEREARGAPHVTGLSDKDADFCRRALGDMMDRTRKVAEKARELGYRVQAATLEGDALYAEHVILPLFRNQLELPASLADEARAGLSNMLYDYLKETDKGQLGTACDKAARAVALYALALYWAGFSAGTACRQGTAGHALLYQLRHVRHGLGLAGSGEPAPAPVAD